MQQSYTKNYIQVYFFQILSIILGFASMFIVVPYLSSDQATFGIYSVCISVNIFLVYADLGFLSAGQKYAAESYAQGDRTREMQMVGFSHFILLIIVLIISGLFLWLSFHPSKIISDIDQHQSQIARQLLLILACFAPTIVIQRLLQTIFSIRVQEYNLQKINILGSILKISSVFYFFRTGHYNIVGYYLFIQIVSLAVSLCGIWMIRQKYDYRWKALAANFRFSQEIFHKTKGLAFSSLFATVSWILYYELDSLSIGKILGAPAVAIYAIGLTLLGFIRSLLGVFFNPFAARFNHLIGMGQQDTFKTFYSHIITITLPIIVYPLTALAIMSPGIVISWVGPAYTQSIEVTRWLILCNILAFIGYPANMLLVAREQIRQIYIIALLMPIIFWGGIALTVGQLGVLSFAIFKFTAFLITGVIYLNITLKFLNVPLWSFIRKTIVPYLPGLAIMICLLLLLQNRFTEDKSKLNLLLNASIVLGGIAAAFLTSICCVKPLRIYLIEIIRRYKSQ